MNCPLHRCLLTLSLVLIAARAVEAQSAPAPGRATAARERTDREELAARHLLRLADGTYFRGLARPLGNGAYEIKEARGWRTLSHREVARARLERDVLDERARLARGVRPEDLPRRLGLCDWMASEGLVGELLRELDGILLLDPDQPRALALLRLPQVTATLPAPEAEPEARPEATLAARAARERARILREGGRAQPATRELWIARLAPLGTPAEHAELLTRELSATVDSRRHFALLALRRVAPGQALAEVERCALLDPARAVRKEARRALRDARDPAVAAHLAPKLASGSAKERLGTIEALGEAGYTAALEPLIEHLAILSAPPAPAQGGGGGTVPRSHFSLRRQVAYVQDFNVEIAQAASIADPIVAFAEEGVVLDVAAATWQLPAPRYEGALTLRALARISGEGWKRTPSEWQRWWEENKGRFVEGVDPRLPPPRTSGD